ncbi:hypothetical protein IAU59_007593 [Kwoniella sp. CBS 9459]
MDSSTQTLPAALLSAAESLLRDEGSWRAFRAEANTAPVTELLPGRESCERLAKAFVRGVPHDWQELLSLQPSGIPPAAPSEDASAPEHGPPPTPDFSSPLISEHSQANLIFFERPDTNFDTTLAPTSSLSPILPTKPTSTLESSFPVEPAHCEGEPEKDEELAGLALEVDPTGMVKDMVLPVPSQAHAPSQEQQNSSSDKASHYYGKLAEGQKPSAFIKDIMQCAAANDAIETAFPGKQAELLETVTALLSLQPSLPVTSEGVEPGFSKMVEMRRMLERIEDCYVPLVTPTDRTSAKKRKRSSTSLIQSDEKTRMPATPHGSIRTSASEPPPQSY